MKKNYATLWTLSLCVLCTGISCKDSEKNNSASPDTEELKVEFSLPEGKYEMEVGFEDTIRVKTDKPASKLTYEWKEAGKVIGTDTLLAFTPTEEKTYNITLTVKSDKLTTEKACQVNGVNPYQNGMLLVNHGEYNFEWNDPIVPCKIDFITPKGHFIQGIIKKENPSFDYNSLKRILPVTSANGKLYILSTDEKTLMTFDARTMKQLGAPISVPLPSDKGLFTGFIVPNEKNGYLLTDKGGVLAISLSNGSITPIQEGNGTMTYENGVPSILYKEKVYILGTIDEEGCRLSMINPNTNKIEENIEFNDCTPRKGVILDNNKMAILSGGPYDSPDNVYILSLESKKMSNSPELEYRYHNGMSAVPGEDAFIYVTSQKNEVCKYNLIDGKSTIIINNMPVPDDTNRLVGTGMRGQHIFVDHEDPDDISKQQIGVYDSKKENSPPIFVFDSFVIHQYKLNQF